MSRTFSIPAIAALLCLVGASTAAAKPCQMDLDLFVGRTVSVTLHLNAILVEDKSESGEVTVYKVQGAGSYETAAGETGRLRIASGRWTNLASDPDRYVKVVLVNGVKKDTHYTITLHALFSGNFAGVWHDDNNTDSGGASGTIACDQ